MINELTRLWTQWMLHPVHGVNALLPEVPRGRVGGGVDDAPAAVEVFDDIDTPDLVLSIDPPEVPAVCVTVDTDIDTSALDRNYLLTGQPVIVAFAYITRDVPAEVAKRDGGYVLRAVKRSVRRMNNQSFSKGYRTLNGIKILSVGRIAEQTVAGGTGKSELWGFVTADFTAVDDLP